MNDIETPKDILPKIKSNWSQTANPFDRGQQEMKPCISSVLETGLEEGGKIDRSTGALMIALEFVGLGKDWPFTFQELTKWNLKNKPALTEKELHSVMTYAYEKKHPYRCDNGNLKKICIGKESCKFASKNSQNAKSYSISLYYIHDYQHRLSNSAKLVYFALIELEKQNKVGPGGLIITNHQTLADVSGISRKTVGKALRELAETPLIVRFEPGSSKQWERKGTIIQRAIPIPPPKQKVPDSKE